MTFSLKVILVGATALTACSSSAPPDGGGGSSGASAGGSGATGSGGQIIDSPAVPSGPRFHPPAGFEDCVHAKVVDDCADGWCKLPPSCFVIGSPTTEWFRGRNMEDQKAVTLTHTIQMQQFEMTRKEWMTLINVDPGPTVGCAEDSCPVTNVSWWDAIHAANLLSKQKGLPACYEPTGCTGDVGKDLDCTGFSDPSASVYECKGYRLATRAEAEYGARAGTISAFYSGDITVQKDWRCQPDANLDRIAWYCANAEKNLRPVGLKIPNGFGLHDILGNAHEWLSELDSTLSSSGGTNPDGRVGGDQERVLYGGRADLPAVHSRVAGRSGMPSEAKGARTGFRLVRTLD